MIFVPISSSTSRLETEGLRDVPKAVFGLRRGWRTHNGAGRALLCWALLRWALRCLMLRVRLVALRASNSDLDH